MIAYGVAAGHAARPPRVIVLKTRFQAMKNYNYLVVDPGLQAVLIDPAWEIDTIEQAVEDAQARVSGILITHAHPDHIHLAGPLAQIYDCPIWMSDAEIAASGFSATRLVRLAADPWAVGRLLIEPILTPGHTPGSTCYLIGENVFTGDVLFAEGCGLCADVPAAHAMFASLEHLKARLTPRTRIFPGHSYGRPPGLTMAEVRKDNMYLQFPTKESFTAFRLRRGQNPARMFSFS